MEESKMKYLILILFLCLTSCKSADVDPTTSVLKYIITNGNSK